MRNESAITTGCFKLELMKVTKATVSTVNDFVVLCPHSKHRMTLRNKTQEFLPRKYSIFLDWRKKELYFD